MEMEPCPFTEKLADCWDVVVVGSCMIDLVSYAPRLPKSGETICGRSFVCGFGGKGCNQCIAAMKLGGNCLLVARIGDDSFGQNYYEQLHNYNISKFVKITDGVSTGVAQITVSETGENQIVIVPGANNFLTENDVSETAAVIANCSVLICQLEIPENTTIEALKVKAKSNKGKSILNAAPAFEALHPLLFTLPDIFCVNETEAEVISKKPVTNTEEAKESVRTFLSKGCKEVVITLGCQGCVYGKQGDDDVIHIPAWPVNAIDTTGAGDAFIGALAVFMATQPDLPMTTLLQKASIVAAVSVQREGSQSSFPTVDELPKEFAEL